MSKIIQLKDFSDRRPSDWRSSDRRPASDRPEGSAQILFFLGVRYSHGEDNAGGNPDGARIGPRVRAPRRAPRRKRA
jgi:hypothetical protein